MINKLKIKQERGLEINGEGEILFYLGRSELASLMTDLGRGSDIYAIECSQGKENSKYKAPERTVHLASYLEEHKEAY